MGFLRTCPKSRRCFASLKVLVLAVLLAGCAKGMAGGPGMFEEVSPVVVPAAELSPTVPLDIGPEPDVVVSAKVSLVEEKPEKPEEPMQAQAQAIEAHGKRIDKIAEDAKEVKRVLEDRKAEMSKSEYRHWKKRKRDVLLSRERAKGRTPEPIK